MLVGNFIGKSYVWELYPADLGSSNRYDQYVIAANQLNVGTEYTLKVALMGSTSKAELKFIPKAAAGGCDQSSCAKNVIWEIPGADCSNPKSQFVGICECKMTRSATKTTRLRNESLSNVEVSSGLGHSINGNYIEWQLEPDAPIDPQAEYTFFTDIGTAECEVTLGENMPPLYGDVDFSPKIILKNKTQVSIRAIGWSDSDHTEPLYYEFLKNGEQWMLSSTMAEISTILTQNTNVSVRVCDSLGACSTSPAKTIIVSSSTETALTCQDYCIEL